MNNPMIDDGRPHVLIHGYGLLDHSHQLVAGSNMSGLTLNNSLIVDGLSKTYRITFLCGCLRTPCVIPHKVMNGVSVVEYDARFPTVLEHNGRFISQLANTMYQSCVAEKENPIYESLSNTYEQLILSERIDVINAHNLNAACTAIHTSIREISIPPIIVTIHDIVPTQLSFVILHQDRVAQFIAVSHTLASQLVSMGIDADRICTIPNALHLKPFVTIGNIRWREVALALGLPTRKKFTILVPARRVQGKGIDLAILAFDRLTQRRSEPMRLLITGAGLSNLEYEMELRELVNTLQSRNQIHFLSELSYDDMPMVYRVSDVCLLPSTAPEGFAYANIEAMATGGPVIVTSSHGGPLDYIVDGYNGFLVPPGNIDAIVETIYQIMNSSDEIRKVRQTARDTATRYDTSTMVEMYDQCIKEVIQCNLP